jgi:hypothetical protein
MASLERANERTRQLVVEGFPVTEALSQAWDEVHGLSRDQFPDGFKLILLRAPNDESHQDPAFQEEIREMEAALRASGVDANARWLTQDSADAWCGYVGVLIITLPIIIKAMNPVIVAYMKRKTGRKVQIECDGFKIKIEEPSLEEADRVLRLIEQKHAAKREKK